jgi:hypothetical protein
LLLAGSFGVQILVVGRNFLIAPFLSTWRCIKAVGRRWSQTNDTTDEKHTLHWRVAQGCHCIYNDCLKKRKPRATKYIDHNACTTSVIAHTTNLVARLLRQRTKRNIVDIPGEDQVGFRRGTSVAIGML